MTYIAKAAVCSEIRTKHSMQSEHNVDFLVVRKETARLWMVKVAWNIELCDVTILISDLCN